jgi:transposase
MGLTLAAAEEALRQKNLQIDTLTKALAAAEQRQQALAHQLELLTRRLYGPKSEKFHPDQLLLDGVLIAGLEQGPAEALTPPAVTDVKPHQRQVPGHGREELPAHLERVEVLLDLAPAEKVCPETGEPLVKIGEERTEKLAYTPERLYVKVFVRPKYASPKKVNGSSVCGLKLAPLPDWPIAKCKADTSLLAAVAVAKYVDHQPLYRQMQIKRRQDVELARQTADGWVLQLADAPLPVLQAALKTEVLASDVLFTDDTPVPLLVEGLGKTREARLWAYRTGAGPPLVVFDFSVDRRKRRPLDFLGDYHGYIHADAYSGYDELFRQPGIVELGCWAHARRKFDEALGSAPSEATEMLAGIRRLYEIEAVAEHLKDHERAALRQAQCPLILHGIFARAVALQAVTLPKSPLAQALTYLLNQRDALQRYLADGRLRPDNNLAENVLRPLALGRKNWLFFGGERGGRAAAIYFSLLQSCVLNKVNPLAYLEDVLNRIMSHPASQLRDLLPHRWKPRPQAG